MLFFISFLNAVLVGSGEKVIALITKENHFVGLPPTLNGTARAIEIEPDQKEINHIIVEFIPRKEMHLIRFDNKHFLCGHYDYKSPAVILCKNENDPFTWWSIAKSLDKKFALKAKGGKCLRPVAKDKRKKSQGYFLHLKKCNGTEDYIWDIQRMERELPDKDTSDQNAELETNEADNFSETITDDFSDSSQNLKKTNELAKSEKDSKESLEFKDIHKNDRVKRMNPKSTVLQIQAELAKNFDRNTLQIIAGKRINPQTKHDSDEDSNIDKRLHVFHKPKTSHKAREE